jgi:hypothetical protein
MLEIISILASLALIVVTPMQTAQICAGKFSPKMKVTPAVFVTSFRRQVVMLTWLGALFGVANIVLMFMETEPGENVVKGVAAALWFGVAGVSFYSSRKLAGLPTPADTGGASS